jgi:O-antigen/teichoic acid export membrane protein
MTDTKRRGIAIFRGASVLFLAQGFVALAQLGYAAFTSRLVEPSEFGAYGVAMVVVAAMNLVAVGGVGQSVMRVRDGSVASRRGAVTYAVVAGLLSGAVLFLTANWWAVLWNVVPATHAIEMLALSTLFAPILSVYSGIARANGVYAKVAVSLIASSVIAIGSGIYFVSTYRNAAALTSFIICQQVLQIAFLGAAAKSSALPGRVTATMIPDFVFSYKVMVSNLREYLILNLVKIALTRSAGGASALGSWSRSDVLTSYPFAMVQTSIMQVVYPEFLASATVRAKARRQWSDMLVLVSWFTMPAGTYLALTLPGLVPLLFGSNWQETSNIIALAAVAACLQPSVVLLSSALEAIGSFKAVFRTQAVLLLVVCGIAVWVFATGHLTVAVTSVIAVAVVRHGIHLTLGARMGLIDVFYVLRSYAIVVACCVTWYTCTYAASILAVAVTSNPALSWSLRILAVCPSVAAVVAVIMLRRSFPPILIARRYGLKPA